MARTLFFTVPESYNDKKLCAFLRGEAQISCTLYGTLRHTPNAVTRDGVLIRSIDRIHTGDVIRVDFPAEETFLRPTEMPLDILYEDEDLLVLNKNGYLAMHPSHGHQEDTLANGVTHYLAETHKDGVFHAVGRLDKGTSGVVLCALNSYAASRMNGNAKKTYLALCDGIPPQKGTIDCPIYRPDPDKTLRACGEIGEAAVTHYEVLESGNGRSLVLVRPETGRTHQIRVHMAKIGVPLVGDVLYGTDVPGLSRHLLHCYSSEITHPVTGETMIFHAKLPEEFRNTVFESGISLPETLRFL